MVRFKFKKKPREPSPILALDTIDVYKFQLYIPMGYESVASKFEM